MPELPVMCTLTPDELRERRSGLLACLVRRSETREQTSDGMRLRFPARPGTLPEIAVVVEAERQCCRFLRFTVSVEPDGGPIVLELSGPSGTREFLETLLGA